ncbi:MAG: hypothetical protein WCI18_13770 [Pseudomonadota bacterium]
MKILFFCVFLVSCRSTNSQVKDDPLGLTGKTGRNVTLNISGIDRSETKEGAHTICAIGLNGMEAITKEIADERLVCVDAALGSSSTTITLKDLSYPSYITIFHDENHNGTLDFGTFDVFIAKTTTPVEGVGVIATENDNEKFSHPIWPEIGTTQIDAQMVYGDLPFWKLAKEQAQNAFWHWAKSEIEASQKYPVVKNKKP